MGYEIIVKPLAEQDLREALQWYEKQQAGLEVELYREVLKVMDTINKNPELFQKRYRNIRIRFTDRFNYGIHYTIENQSIYIHAILHTSRKPRK